MRRLLITLDDELYEALRRLAFEKKTQMAKLVRHAIDRTFEDDLDGIIGEMRLKEDLKDPSGSVTIEELMKEYGIAVPRRRESTRKAGHRRVAG
jgi:hypothetical protein